MVAGESRVCRVCGRRFAWRARWARNWAAVRHCSRACSRRGLRPVDRRLEAAVEALVSERAPRSACPSEAARRVDPDRWRELMEPARMAVRRLYHRGCVRITQHGKAVDPDHMRGPVRVLAPR